MPATRSGTGAQAQHGAQIAQSNAHHVLRAHMHHPSCTCVRACMYVCTCAFMCACVCVCMCMCKCVCVRAHACACATACVCAYASVCACVGMRPCLCRQLLEHELRVPLCACANTHVDGSSCTADPCFEAGGAGAALERLSAWRGRGPGSPAAASASGQGWGSVRTGSASRRHSGMGGPPVRGWGSRGLMLGTVCASVHGRAANSIG